MNEKNLPSVLLLIHHSSVFEGMKTMMQKEGYRVCEDLDVLTETDLVLMDSFYLNAGTADFVKSENRRISAVLVHFPHEAGNIKKPLMDLVDNTIVFQSSGHTGNTFF